MPPRPPRRSGGSKPRFGSGSGSGAPRRGRSGPGSGRFRTHDRPSGPPRHSKTPRALRAPRPASDHREFDRGYAPELPDAPERLQKVLAHAGVASRRGCEEVILQGRVTVNGKITRELGAKVNPAKDVVELDGEPIRLERLVYFAVNKPKGYVSTNVDPDNRPRVIDLLPRVPQRVYTVGRLDEASTGLILLTNDGELANRLAHPKYGVEKRYVATVAGSPGPDIVAQLVEGVWLSDGKVRARRARILGKQGQATRLEIVLSEGKNREIRRMLARLGHKVMTLTRVCVGPITLKGIPVGEARPLTHAEVSQLRAIARIGETGADANANASPAKASAPRGAGAPSRPFAQGQRQGRNAGAAVRGPFQGQGPGPRAKPFGRGAGGQNPRAFAGQTSNQGRGAGPKPFGRGPKPGPGIGQGQGQGRGPGRKPFGRTPPPDIEPKLDRRAILGLEGEDANLFRGMIRGEVKLEPENPMIVAPRPKGADRKRFLEDRRPPKRKHPHMGGGGQARGPNRSPHQRYEQTQGHEYDRGEGANDDRDGGHAEGHGSGPGRGFGRGRGGPRPGPGGKFAGGPPRAGGAPFQGRGPRFGPGPRGTKVYARPAGDPSGSGSGIGPGNAGAGPRGTKVYAKGHRPEEGFPPRTPPAAIPAAGAPPVPITAPPRSNDGGDGSESGARPRPPRIGGAPRSFVKPKLRGGKPSFKAKRPPR